MISHKLISLLLFFTFFALSGCSNNKIYEINGNAFGTIYYISIKNEKSIDLKKLKSDIDHILNIVDNSASNYKINSEISSFNNYDGTNFKTISSNLYNIIQKAKIVGDKTNGFFDITLGDIKILKGFYVNKKKIKRIDTRNFSYKDITLSNGNLIKKPFGYVNIDLSGIAKGYAVDLIYNYLKTKNITSFLVNIGGEIKVHSKKSDFVTLGVDDPTKQHQYIEEILINDKAIATSGTNVDTLNYEGEEISHITNPKTLENISNLNLLVSVIHKECTIADGLATGLIAMNPSEIISFSNDNNIATMLTIFENNSIEKYYSLEFMKYVKN